MTKNEIALSLKNISKSFINIKALDNISMDFNRGKITALVGDNGAGKSTIIKIISGVLKPDCGEIIIDGISLKYLTTKQAINYGISTVYQDLSLGDTMDVVSNIFLGREITKLGFLNKNKMKDKATKVLNDLDINIPALDVPVGSLSGGQRQGIAVARLLNNEGKVFIFDEPTAAMGITESEAVLSLIRKLSFNGYTVILVSHNIMQVVDISDYIYVLKNGKISEKIINDDTVDLKMIIEYITDGGKILNEGGE
ncbi:ATP-binding cassette domain-containing protein [Facklamia hominis]|uniref:ATP-binding cassette domain-containing protein n=1 Tax=Facklamia hominis TaxID=178214 RepID=UPI0038FC19EA